MRAPYLLGNSCCSPLRTSSPANRTLMRSNWRVHTSTDWGYSSSNCWEANTRSYFLCYSNSSCSSSLFGTYSACSYCECSCICITNLLNWLLQGRLSRLSAWTRLRLRSTRTNVHRHRDWQWQIKRCWKRILKQKLRIQKLRFNQWQREVPQKASILQLSQAIS